MPTPTTDADIERLDQKQRDEAIIDLTAMRYDLDAVIARGGHRPQHQLQLLRRRRDALAYAIKELHKASYD